MVLSRRMDHQQADNKTCAACDCLAGLQDTHYAANATIFLSALPVTSFWFIVVIAGSSYRQRRPQKAVQADVGQVLPVADPCNAKGRCLRMSFLDCIQVLFFYLGLVLPSSSNEQISKTGKSELPSKSLACF